MVIVKIVLKGKMFLERKSSARSESDKDYYQHPILCNEPFHSVPSAYVFKSRNSNFVPIHKAASWINNKKALLGKFRLKFIKLFLISNGTESKRFPDYVKVLLKVDNLLLAQKMHYEFDKRKTCESFLVHPFIAIFDGDVIYTASAFVVISFFLHYAASE